MESQQSARLAEAEALLRGRGKSVLVQNAYGPSQKVIWSGLVRRLNGMRHEQTGRDITLICLVGGGQVCSQTCLKEAQSALMVD